MRALWSLIVAAAVAAFLPAGASAQSCPPWGSVKTLTVGQWQACFDAKQNALGFVPVNKAGDTMQGPLTAIASGTAGAGLNLPPGVAPLFPNDGDIWVTASGMAVQVNGGTVPLGTAASSVAIGITNVTGGTSGRVLSETAGVLSEYPVSGTGNVALTTSPVFTTPNLGVPSAVNLINGTGLPIGGIAGLGTGIGTFLATPSSANLASALTDETGSGVVVFGTSPTITTPTLVNPTITGSVTATGLVKLSDLAVPTTTSAGPIRVAYQLTGVNFNAANSDNAVTLNLPASYTRFMVSNIKITHASQTLTTSTFGLFTAAAGGGTAIMTATAITVSTATANTANNAMSASPATANTVAYTSVTQLFFRVQTAQGAAATADVNIELFLMP